MIRLSYYVSLPFIFLFSILLIIFYGEEQAEEFLDSVHAFFYGLK